MRTIIATVLLAVVTTGCASYRDFDHLDPIAERTQEAVLAGLRGVGDDTPSDEVRDRRLAYYRWITSTNIQMRMLVLRAELSKWTAEEYRLLERVFEGSFEFLEAYASFRGEMNGAGEITLRPEGPTIEERIAG
ncbi:MAG: hypothetical protein AAGH64_06410, partial [Planctomycetota bacterium]